LAARVAPDVRELIFTAHGLAVVRPTLVHVFGGPEGDFFVETPRGSGTPTRVRTGGIAVSRDGHRIVFDRGNGYHADVVDLQTRTVATSFSFVPGEPKLAFAPDGQRVIAAGLLGGSYLGSWQIRAPVPQKILEGAPTMNLTVSRDGQRMLMHLGGPLSADRWVLYDAAGTQLLAGALGLHSSSMLTPDGRRVMVRDDDGVTLLDAENGQVVWKLGCKDCFRLDPSGDGSRLFTSSGKRLAIYGIGSQDPIWTEIRRVGHIAEGMNMSVDGSRVAWVSGTTAYVHTIGSATDLEAAFDEDLRDLEFSNDGQRLLIA